MITTKKGDGGETDCGGKRVSKDSLLVEVIGEIDELQAVMELVGGDKEVIKDLGGIMGELGCVRCQFSDLRSQIKNMESKIEKSEVKIDNFIIFRTKKAKELNWARTVCRRVEREIVSLSKQQTIDKDILKYFNRLSDYLYVLALKNN